MSAATATNARGLPRRSRAPDGVPWSLVAFATVAISAAVGLICAGVWRDREVIEVAGWDLVVWVGAVATVGLASVSSDDGPQLGLDLPLLLAAGFVFGPGIGGAIAFVAYADMRELRGEISLLRALYNRAQTALSVIFAAAVFAGVGVAVTDWPMSALAALLALAADSILNYGFVVTAKTLNDGAPPARVLRSLFLGTPGSFAVTYVAYGLLSLLLAHVYVGSGAWAVAAFALPVVMARQTFSQGKELRVAGDRLAAQSEALRIVSTRVADERRDERLAVAAGLHDEVLPALVNVHIMGQVLRQDLAAGRLLELEDDIPGLLVAITAANEAVRDVINGLRRSALGPTGFKRTLELLVEHLQTLSSAKFTVDVEEIGGAPHTQLVAYQVVQEALNNAVRHSGASTIRVRAGVEDGKLRIMVEDDGLGFTSSSIDGSSHFGLAMMRERVEVIGGVLHIESSTDGGTRVLARLPLELDREDS